MRNAALRQRNTRMLLSKCRYLVLFPSISVPTLANESFIFKNKQPINMQGDYWTMIASTRHILFFADSRGREKNSYF